MQKAQRCVEIVEAKTKTVSSHDESIRITEAATKGHCDMPNPELHPEKKSLTTMRVGMRVNISRLVDFSGIITANPFCIIRHWERGPPLRSFGVAKEYHLSESFV